MNAIDPAADRMDSVPGPAPHRRRCTSTAKSTGKRCKRAPIRGGSVCAVHGGGAPQVRDAAGRRVAEAEAQQAAARLALPVKTTAAEALIGELHRTAGLVAYLEAECARLASPVWSAEHLHPLVSWWEREREHLADVAVAMERIGVEKRQVRVTEIQAVQFARTLRAILGDLHALLEDHPEAQRIIREGVPRIAPKRIRELMAS